MKDFKKTGTPEGDTVRIIKTARSKESINNAARNGFNPLVKKITPSSAIHSKYAVRQNTETGEIQVIYDFRMGGEQEGFIMVIDWTNYYPHNFESPFAAYLVPGDIKAGERVFLEDLIEDFVGTVWNQGDTFRLKGCIALWNGKDFDIQYDPAADYSHMLG